MIGLVKVIRKVCASIINNTLWDTTTLHDALHGFRKGRGTRTATMEAKMAQQLARLCHEPLFHVLLDVRKSYDSLDTGRYMEILRGYQPRPTLQRLLQWYWDEQAVVSKAGKIFEWQLGQREG